ncbi:MAG: hypothetical protein BWZ10_01925 [candidate division BRC1 bacterium ADurb.BinA364]|nr:MAG: hypothetical protein BWZ10_01925 [candidate division BRC1 bacterium ADurb.BinA364]
MADRGSPPGSAHRAPAMFGSERRSCGGANRRFAAERSRHGRRRFAGSGLANRIRRAGPRHGKSNRPRRSRPVRHRHARGIWAGCAGPAAAAADWPRTGPGRGWAPSPRSSRSKAGSWELRANRRRSSRLPWGADCRRRRRFDRRIWSLASMRACPKRPPRADRAGRGFPRPIPESGRHGRSRRRRPADRDKRRH